MPPPTEGPERTASLRLRPVVDDHLRFYWLIPAQWFAHFADEAWFGFPEWATRHFAPLPRGLWIPGMLVGCVATTALAWRAGRRRSSAWVPFAATTIQSIFASNALFHGVASCWLRGYSPGTATGMLVFLPATFAYWRCRRREPRLGLRAQASAASLGFVLHGLVVASLFVSKA